MIKGLPILLTYFLPGQEEGNVTYVERNKIGEFCSDESPECVANLVNQWLRDRDELRQKSNRAKELAQPDAARQISKCILKKILPDILTQRTHANIFRAAPTLDVLAQTVRRTVNDGDPALEK